MPDQSLDAAFGLSNTPAPPRQKTGVRPLDAAFFGSQAAPQTEDTIKAGPPAPEPEPTSSIVERTRAQIADFLTNLPTAVEDLAIGLLKVAPYAPALPGIAGAEVLSRAPGLQPAKPTPEEALKEVAPILPDDPPEVVAMKQRLAAAKLAQANAQEPGLVQSLTGINTESVKQDIAEGRYGKALAEVTPAAALTAAGVRAGIRQLKASPALEKAFELEAPKAEAVAAGAETAPKVEAVNVPPAKVEAAEAPSAIEQPPVSETPIPTAGPKYAANINLERLSTGEDVKNLIREMAQDNKAALSAQGRGNISHADTATSAAELGMTVDQLTKLKPGQTMNAEELLAARRLNVGTAEALRDAVKAYQQSDSTPNLLAVQAAMQQHLAVLKSVSGATAEAGRALSQFRIISEAVRQGKVSNYEKVLSALGGRELTAELAQKLAQIPEGDLPALNRFLREASQFSTADKVSAYWTANILSGPRTSIRNLVGNTIFAATQFPTRVVRGLIDAPLSRMAGRPQEYYAREALPATIGYFAGLPDGLRRAAYIVKNGFDVADAAKLELPKQYNFPGGAKNPWNWPGRYLVAADAMAKTQALQSELYAIATRQALREGLKGKAAWSRISELVQNPTAEMVDKASGFARYTTFNSKPDAFSQRIIGLREVPIPGTEIKPLRFVIPFVNTPFNILKRGLEYSPVGAAKLIKTGWRSPEAADVLGKAAIGSMTMAGLATLAANGNLTGAAPSEPAKRDAFFRGGKQPFSIRIGGRWYQYNMTTGPLALAMAAVAGFHDAFAEKGEVPNSKRIAQAASVVGNAIVDQSFFSGLESLLNAMTDPERYGERWAANAASGFLPMSGLQRNVAQAIDPTIRDAQGIYEKVISGIPIVSKTLPPKVDVLGREQQMEGGTGLAAFLPTRIPKDQAKSAVDSELNRLEIFPGAVGKTLTVASQKVELSREQQRQYQQATGQMMYRVLDAVFSSPQYAALPDEQKAKLVDTAIGAARDAGKMRFLAGVVHGSGKLKLKGGH